MLLGFLPGNTSWLRRGRRVMMESSMGAIQKFVALASPKAASENLIDDRGYLNTRLGKVLSLQVGEDGLQPFHARGPDNPGGTSLSFSHTFWQRSGRITLHDECDMCQERKMPKSQLGRLLRNIVSKLTEKFIRKKELAKLTTKLSTMLALTRTTLRVKLDQRNDWRDRCRECW